MKKPKQPVLSSRFSRKKELKGLAEKFDLWQERNTGIQDAQKPVSANLQETPVSAHDLSLAGMLKKMYPPAFIDTVEIIQIDDCSFLLSRKDLDRYTSHHTQTLRKAAQSGLLINPTYVSIDHQGVLLLD